MPADAALAQAEQALRDAAAEHDAAVAAGEVRLVEYGTAAEAVDAALTPPQRRSLGRAVGVDRRVDAVVTAMSSGDTSVVGAWWAATAEDTYERVSRLTGWDHGTASLFVGASLYALHLAGQDVTTQAVVDLSRAALAFHEGRRTEQRKLEEARG